MPANADKTQQENSQTNAEPQSLATAAPQFADHRPQTAALARMQALSLKGPQQQRLQALQAMAANSPQAQKLAQMQSLMRQAAPPLPGLRQANNQPAAPAALPTQLLAEEEDLPAQAQGLEHQPATSQPNAPAPETPPTAENRTGLPDKLKAGVESLSGISLDQARVHYNSSRPAQLNALAYAQGTDIHLGPGQERHLPHEAWHVAQQAQGRVSPTRQMKEGLPINDDEGLEREADLMGSKATDKSALPKNKLMQKNVSLPTIQRMKRILPNQADKKSADKKKKSINWNWKFDESPAKLFNDLEYVQKEQIIALSRGITHFAEGIFEQQLRDFLYTHYVKEIAKLGKELEKKTNTNVSWSKTKRDQTNRFPDLDISNLNKLFGGSINSTKTEKILTEVSEENSLDGGGIKEDSQYAEVNRTNRNRISAGLDSRIGEILNSTDIDKHLARALLFAYIKTKSDMSFFEVCFSAKNTLPFEFQGIYIYRELPKELLTGMKWERYPDFFSSPEFLRILSTCLHNKHGLEEFKLLWIPREILLKIQKSLDALITEQGQIRSSLINLDNEAPFEAQAPSVLLDELKEEDRIEMQQVDNQNAYMHLLQKFKKNNNVVAYILSKLTFGRLYHDRDAKWYEKLAQVLTPEELRKGTLDTGVLKKKQKPGQKKRLIKNASQISKTLGKFDYGISVTDKMFDLEELIADDPDGAYSINKYISGAFGDMSDALNAPWNAKGNDETIKKLHATVAGLEKLPIYSGWVYRREEEIVNHPLGMVISPGVLWSASTSPKFNIQFDREEKGTLYIVECKYSGKDVQLLAGPTKWYQREVLFPPYARFVVEHKKFKQNGQCIYILRELSPTGKSPEVDEAMNPIPMTKTGETKQIQTLIDKRHFDIAIDKYNKQEAWTQKEIDEQHLEGLSSGIYHPRDLYGPETFKRWQKTLGGETSETFWTVDGFLQIASEISGEKVDLRNEWTGWGKDEDTYKLTPSQADNLVALHCRVGRYVDKADFKDFAKIKRLPRQFKDGDYTTKVNAKDWAKNPANDLWLWREDFKFLVEENIAIDQDAEYFVTYGLGENSEIANSLERLLTACQKNLESAKKNFNEQKTDTKAYAEQVTQLAAGLQQELVALHPLSDANGRISRMYMYKVLRNYLPGNMGYDKLPIIEDTGQDLTSSKQDWGNMLWDQVKKTGSGNQEGLSAQWRKDFSSQSQDYAKFMACMGYREQWSATIDPTTGWNLLNQAFDRYVAWVLEPNSGEQSELVEQAYKSLPEADQTYLQNRITQSLYTEKTPKIATLVVDNTTETGIKNVGNSCYLAAGLNMLAFSEYYNMFMGFWRCDIDRLDRSLLRATIGAMLMDIRQGKLIETDRIKQLLAELNVRGLLPQPSAVDRGRGVTSLTAQHDPSEVFFKKIFDFFEIQNLADMTLNQTYRTTIQAPLIGENPELLDEDADEYTKVNIANQFETTVPLMSLELPIRGSDSLQQAMRNYLRPEVIENVKYTDQADTVRQGDAERRILLGDQNPLLITISLQRWAGGLAGKDQRSIAMPNQFKLNGFVYQLQTVVYHHGPTPDSGHYTASTKNLGADGWKYRNDDNVSDDRSFDERKGFGYLYTYSRARPVAQPDADLLDIKNP